MHSREPTYLPNVLDILNLLDLFCNTNLRLRERERERERERKKKRRESDDRLGLLGLSKHFRITLRITIITYQCKPGLFHCM